MGCLYLPELRGSEFALSIREKVLDERVPLTGSIELTHRCNNACVFCYCNLSPDDYYARTGEMSVPELEKIFREVASEGCLYMLLTGGEPTLRPDFKEIWIAAKKAGLLLSLFTNATLITPELADFLAEWPARSVEVTLYGYSREVYENVTKLPGSWEKCYRGVYNLHERGIPLSLKTFVCSLNRHEFGAMKNFAVKELGLPFRWDAQAKARIDGSLYPYNFSLSPQEILELEMEEKEKWDLFLEYADLYWGRPKDNKLFNCGAGISMFHIDPYGKLGICHNVRHITHDLRKLGNFRAAWDGKLADYRMTREAPADQPCRTCDSYGVCGSCPGRSLFEHGNDHQRVESRCDLTQLRTLKIKEIWAERQEADEALLAEMMGAAPANQGHGCSSGSCGCGAANKIAQIVDREIGSSAAASPIL